VIDPAGAYWSIAAKTLPPGVPMLNLSPHLEGATILDIAATVDDDPSAANNVVSAFMGVDDEGGGEAKDSDPFWPKKARALLFMLVTVFIRRAKGRWRFADLVVPFRWPEFLAPVLAQTADTRASAAYEIAGKMGKGIVASASAELNELCIVAAYSQRATRTFTFREMMRRSAYMHVCYDPGIAGGYARYASALTRLLELTCYAHGSEHNLTIILGDEGRELRNLHLGRIAARGRQAGLGVILAAQTFEGLVAKWGEKHAREALGLAGTFVCFAASPDTAEYFSKLVGQQEVIEVTFNDGVSVNSGSTWGDVTTHSANTTFINHENKWEEPFLSLNTWMMPQHRDDVGESVSIGISKARSYGGSDGIAKSSGRANRLAVRDTLLPSQLVHQLLADKKGDCLDAYFFNRQVGVCKIRPRWLHIFEHLPRIPHVPVPRPRPTTDGMLLRWTRADLQRLGLDLTDDLLEALNS
jgi:hypothetical protein